MGHGNCPPGIMDTKTDAIALSRQSVGPIIRSDAQGSSPPPLKIRDAIVA